MICQIIFLINTECFFLSHFPSQNGRSNVTDSVRVKINQISAIKPEMKNYQLVPLLTPVNSHFSFDLFLVSPNIYFY